MENKKYDATLDSIGEWGGREAEAVSRWNRLVAPELRALRDAATDADGYMESAAEAAMQHAAQVAWEEFCSPGGSRAAVRAARKWAPRRAQEARS